MSSDELKQLQKQVKDLLNNDFSISGSKEKIKGVRAVASKLFQIIATGDNKDALKAIDLLQNILHDENI